jgi:hypothetical protein
MITTRQVYLEFLRADVSFFKIKFQRTPELVLSVVSYSFVFISFSLSVHYSVIRISPLSCLIIFFLGLIWLVSEGTSAIGAQSQRPNVDGCLRESETIAVQLLHANEHSCPVLTIQTLQPEKSPITHVTWYQKFLLSLFILFKMIYKINSFLNFIFF